MRIPILLLNAPGEKFWLTDERPESPRGLPVLIDAAGHLYPPADLPPSVLFVKGGTCGYDFYDAARSAGYPVMWMD